MGGKNQHSQKAGRRGKHEAAFTASYASYRSTYYYNASGNDGF